MEIIHCNCCGEEMEGGVSETCEDCLREEEMMDALTAEKYPYEDEGLRCGCEDYPCCGH